MKTIKLTDAVRACEEARFVVQAFAHGVKSEAFLIFAVSYSKKMLCDGRYNSGPEFLFNIDHAVEIDAIDFERKLASAVARRDGWDAEYAVQVEARGY